MSMPTIKVQGFSCNRNVNRPAAILGVITLGVIGSIVFLLLPMLIGAFTENLSFTAAQVGLLGSADMTGMFIAAGASVLLNAMFTRAGTSCSNDF